jgi:hypothetical protein
LLLFLLLGYFGRQTEYFGYDGWMSLDAYKNARISESDPQAPNFRPPVASWSPSFGTTSPTAVHALYFGSLAAAALFTFGIATRITAPLAWLAAVSFTSNPILAAYGGDSLLLILTFYLMIGYVLMGLWNGDRTPTALVLGQRRMQESAAANLALRMLQVHFAILVFTTGIVKLQTGFWWEGLALWFPMNPPTELTLDRIKELRNAPDAYATWLGVLSLFAYAALAWQISYPFLAWRGRWRYFIVAGAAIGWVGTWWIYRLPIFGPGLFIGSLAYLTPGDWRWVLRRFVRPAT